MKADTNHPALTFLPYGDALALEVNQKANELWHLLKHFDSSKLVVDDFFKDYFAKHHLGNRLYFSIENSAHIIYQSVKKTGKPIEKLSFLDYGAGLGTLFMLGGLMKFREVYYNDHLTEWQLTAKSICESIGIKLTDYIVGDIENVTDYANDNLVEFNIIASRNVLEHIYNLSDFYRAIYKHNPEAVIFSTTTANYHNPVVRWQHQLIHRGMEKKHYFHQRKQAIRKILKPLTEADLNKLTALTRGKAFDDFTDTIHKFAQHKNIVPDPLLRTNTCDFSTGVWAEHLVKQIEYKNIIEDAGFNMEYYGGFWDTHYSSPLFNFVTRIFNKIIPALGKKGYMLAPFVNVIAYPKEVI